MDSQTSSEQPRYLYGRFAARCERLAKTLRKIGQANKMHKTSRGGYSWEVLDQDEDERYTGMVYRVSVERSRWIGEIIGKRPWEI